MGSEAEPAKQLLPYLQRADELQKHEPLVSYYCRLFAMEKGLKIPQKERTKTTNALLISLMNQLEKDKKSINLGAEDNLYVEGFASNVFAKADKQDRAGRADLNTAKTFYAASIFFDILSQFGELLPDIEQRQKYAVWKAADIRKALKEGRKPESGPPDSYKDSSYASDVPTNAYDLGRSESFPSSHQNQNDIDAPLPRPYKDMGGSESRQTRYPDTDESAQSSDKTNSAADSSVRQPSYSSRDYDYSSTDYNQNPPSGRSETSAYHQPYQGQPYSSEQHYITQNYHSHESPNPTYSYPNFQSYPSLNDSTSASAPTHLPSHLQSPGSPYSHQSPPSAANYTPQYNLPDDSSNARPSPPVAASFVYDSNYQPPVEKISEAHKAARFAVGALAFDDVTTAVDFLRRSLELLTNPSAEIH